MKPDDAKLDLAAPAALLELGRALSEAVAPYRNRQENAAAAVGPQLEATLEALRGSAVAKKLLGLTRGAQTERDVLRVKIVATIAWKMLSVHVPSHFVSVADLAAAAAGENGSCGDFLTCRHLTGLMATEGVLVPSPQESGGWNMAVGVNGKILQWVAGGRHSLAVLNGGRLAAMRCNKAPADAEQEEAPPPAAIPSASHLSKMISARVVGLDRQVSAISSRLVLHNVRARMIREGRDPGGGNCAIILAGSSGSGKTWLVESAASVCRIPFASIDATHITSEGFQGGKLDDLWKAAVAAAPSVREAGLGLLLVDEADKLSAREGRDVNTVAIQQELLRPLQGAVFSVGGKRGNGFDPPFLFDSRGATFFFAGCFHGLGKVIERKTRSNCIGFDCGRKTGVRAYILDCIKEMGFLEEFCNRIAMAVRLDDPSVRTLIEAAVSPHGAVSSWNRLLSGLGVQLKIGGPALRLCCDYAIECGGFHRGVRSLVGVLASEIVSDGRKGAIEIGMAEVRRAIDQMAGIGSPTTPDGLPSMDSARMTMRELSAAVESTAETEASV